MDFFNNYLGKIYWQEAMTEPLRGDLEKAREIILGSRPGIGIAGDGFTDKERFMVGQIAYCLSSARQEVMAEADLLVAALNDWIISHAPEFCAAKDVKETAERISRKGTLAYIAGVVERWSEFKAAHQMESQREMGK